MFWLNRHRRLRDQLSAYIDGALGSTAAKRLEVHLVECQSCRNELEQLRSTVSALRELPEARVPRSFALSAERAAARPPAVPAAPLAFGVRIAAAGVAVALAIVLVVDIGNLGGRGAAPEAAPTGTVAERQADQSKTAAEDAAAAAREEAEAQGGAALEPYGTPTAGLSGTPQAGGEEGVASTPSPAPTVPPDTTIVPLGPEEVPATSGLTPEPEAGIKEVVPATGGGGGIDALTAVEIGLAAALSILVVGSLILALATRKR